VLYDPGTFWPRGRRELTSSHPPGGGHSFCGASSSAGGIVLDLNRYMTKVTVDRENVTVTAQAGAKWADVDNEAIKFQLACVGGTVNDTGVAGVSGERARETIPDGPTKCKLPISLPLVEATGFFQVDMDS
jgi:hypothetical protein